MKKFKNWLSGIKKYLLYLVVFFVIAGIATSLYFWNVWVLIGFLILVFAALLIIPAILRARKDLINPNQKVKMIGIDTEKILARLLLILVTGAMAYILYLRAPDWASETFWIIIAILFFIFLLDKLFEKIFKKNT
jgi:hypothetical protein